MNSCLGQGFRLSEDHMKTKTRRKAGFLILLKPSSLEHYYGRIAFKWGLLIFDFHAVNGVIARFIFQTLCIHGFKEVKVTSAT